MESKELLASLAKMEESLNEVESARKQVESTVKASSELQKEVKEYVSAVKTLCVRLQSWETDLSAHESSISHEYEAAITQINSTCTEVISAFETGIEKTSKDFKSKTEPIIVKFSEQNDKLSEEVKELVALQEHIKKATEEIESVKSTLNEILKELKDSQDEQDAALEDLKSIVSGLNEKIESSKGAVLQAITHSEQSLSGILHQTNEKIDGVGGKTDSLASSVARLTTICQNIDILVQSSTNSITSTINKTKEEVISTIQESKAEALKSVKINRWLIIAGIVILVILQFVFK